MDTRDEWDGPTLDKRAGPVQSDEILWFLLILSLPKDAAVAGVVVRQAHHEREKGLCTSLDKMGRHLVEHPI
ncbi:MAG: hypothetical protein OXF79_30555 [Chloroflexi bacterium]|nr:hypothetical protein [Chloroflexota bacterium]